MGELNGKVAIVTGAGRLRGIGRAAAVALAKLGADIVVTGTGRNPETFPDDEKAIDWKDIESVAEQIRGLGVRALPLVSDVTKQSDVLSMVDDTIKAALEYSVLKKLAHLWSYGERSVDEWDTKGGILV